MLVLLGTVFAASLLGSLHCVGMCGPFALLAGANRQSNSGVMSRTAAYSGGRLLTYMIVGAVFGTLGMALNKGASFAQWQQTSTYVAGGLMIVVGLIALARQAGYRIQLPGVADQLQSVLQKLFQPVIRQPPFRKAFLIGALTCLMPCGWLYTFAIVAAGTGSPSLGAIVMAAFWFGTVPVMAALMLGFDKLGSSIQRRVPATMACLVIVVGVFTIFYRAPVAIGNEAGAVQQRSQLVEQVEEIDHDALPCCAPQNHPGTGE